MTSPVLITGVGKRVGEALAQDLIHRQHPVIGTYRTDRTAIGHLRDLGADLYQVDFYDADSVGQFISEVKQKYSSLRGIIHNASDWLAEDLNNFSEDPGCEIIEKMMCVHVNVPYRMNLAFRDLLFSSPKGGYDEIGSKDIIHFTDFVCDKGSKKHLAYAASKAALENLTLSFSQLYAPQIKVNSIAPALLLFNEGDTPEYKKKSVQKNLLPQEGGFFEAVEAVRYLMNSRYVTGRVMHLDGGRHLK